MRRMAMVLGIGLFAILAVAACGKKKRQEILPPLIQANPVVEDNSRSSLFQLDQAGIVIRNNTLTVVCDRERGNVVYIVGGGYSNSGSDHNAQVGVSLAVVHQPCQQQ